MRTPATVVTVTTELAFIEARIERDLDLATQEIHSGLARYRSALNSALTHPGLLRNDEERAEFQRLLAGIEALQARIQLCMGGPT